MIYLCNTEGDIQRCVDVDERTFILATLPFIVPFIDFTHEDTTAALLKIDVSGNIIKTILDRLSSTEIQFLTSGDYPMEACMVCFQSAYELETGCDLKDVTAIKLLLKTRPSIANLAKIDVSVVHYNKSEAIDIIGSHAESIFSEDILNAAYLHTTFIISLLFGVKSDKYTYTLDLHAYELLRATKYVDSMDHPVKPVKLYTKEDNPIETLEELEEAVRLYNLNGSSYYRLLIIPEKDLNSVILKNLKPIIDAYMSGVEGYYLMSAEDLLAFVTMSEFNLYSKSTKDTQYIIADVLSGYQSYKENKLGFDNYNFSEEDASAYTSLCIGKTFKYAHFVVALHGIYRPSFIQFLSSKVCLTEIFNTVLNVVMVLRCNNISKDTTESDAQVMERLYKSATSYCKGKHTSHETSLIKEEHTGCYRIKDFNLHVGLDLLYISILTILYKNYISKQDSNSLEVVPTK